MEKVIKEFKNKDLMYRLGYNLYYNKVYPRIEIYKDGVLLSGGYWGNWADGGLFYFVAYHSSSNANGSFGTIKEMFNKLRKYNEIPQNIENEFENMFIMYKLNDFNKI